LVRLKPGVSRQQAQQEVSALANRLETAYPETNRGRGIKLFPLWETPFNNAGALAPTLGIALGVVVFVLLIASANVCNLLLVRSFARRQEMTVRMALGAGRGRSLKQLFMECLILSTFAVVGGLIMAYWSCNLLVRLIPWRGRPMYLAGELDWRVFALSAKVGLLSTLLSLVPAMQSGRIDLAAALKAGSASVVGARGKVWVRSSLVLVQVSLSFILLVGAGLVIRDLQLIPNRQPLVLNRTSAGHRRQSERRGLRFSECEGFSRRVNGSCPGAPLKTRSKLLIPLDRKLAFSSGLVARRAMEDSLEWTPPRSGESRLSVIASILPLRSPSTAIRRRPASSPPSTTTK
jgi:hypothetical protein